MRETDIKDIDIPGADPAALLEQFEPWINKIANRYKWLLKKTSAFDMEDLRQAGRMALITAQKTYVPGISSFLTWSFKPIRNAIQKQIREFSYKNKLVATISLDAPITYGKNDDESTDTLMDSLPDPDYIPFDDIVCEEETRQETAAVVRAAVARMKDKRQQEIIRRVYFEDQDKKAAADDMGIDLQRFKAEERNARARLSRDYRLRSYVLPSFSVGLSAFKRTFTSSVEAAVIWREEHLHIEAAQPDQEP